MIQFQQCTLFFLKQFSVVWKALMSGKLQARMACRTGSYETTHPYFVNRSARYLSFNACIQQGCCPKVWKMADVLPIPKVHPPMSVQSDLRPISPTATISKHLEAIVGQWILTYVSDQIDKRQYGSLKGRSTTHALIDIVHH